MRRRAFLLVALAPLAAAAQRPSKLPRVGFVSPTTRGRRDVAFVQGLRELGYADGSTVSLSMRFADGDRDRLQMLVDELVRDKVDVLVVGSTIGALAASGDETGLQVF